MKVLAVILIALSVALAEELATKKTEKRWVYGSGYGYNDGRYNTLGNYNQAYNQYGGYDSGLANYGYSGYSQPGINTVYGSSPYSTSYGSSGYVYNRPLNNLAYPNNYNSGYSGAYNNYAGYSGAYPNYSNGYNNRYNNYNDGYYNRYNQNSAYTGYNGYNNGYNNGYTNGQYSNYNNGGYYPSTGVIGLPYSQQAYSQRYNSDGYVY